MTHITNPRLLERVDRFLRGITKKDKVCIIHDTDPDGIGSGAIMAQCVHRLRGKKVDLVMPVDREEYGLTAKMMKRIKQKKITKLITCDFAAEGKPHLLKRIEKQADILIVDHHKIGSNYKSKKCTIYKPQYFSTVEPARYCTGKLAYDAAIRVVDVSDLDWMAAAACIADIATQPWRPWLKKVFKKHKVRWQKDLFRTEIGQVAVTVSSTEVYDSKLVPKMFNVFYVAKKPKDVINSTFGKYKKVIDKELQKHLKWFLKKSAKKGQLHIYEMTSEYRVHSPLSTILGLKYPHKTIIIINKTHPQISASARRGDKKIAVNVLLEKAIKGFPHSNAGGHIPAAGAGFPRKYLETFKERLWTTST